MQHSHLPARDLPPRIDVHPVIEAAGRRGELPAWAVMSEGRREHAERVTRLLSEWAETLGLSEQERIRWRAAGRLHDAMKNAPAEELRRLADEGGWPERARDWPEPVLHAPAAAGRLVRDGVDDEEFLLAVAYHPVGHPSFRELGVHLYLADFLEPGRRDGDHLDDWRAAMPAGRDEILPRVIRRRIEHRLASGEAVMPVSIGFWNRTVGA